MVPRGGLEPPRSYEQRILSPVRLPITTSGHFLKCLPFHHIGIKLFRFLRTFLNFKEQLYLYYINVPIFYTLIEINFLSSSTFIRPVYVLRTLFLPSSKTR